MSIKTLVAKFGSSRLANAQDFRQVLDLVQSAPGLRLVVLSASADTMTQLGALFDAAQTGSAAKVAVLYERIYEHHTQLAQALALSQADFATLNQCLTELLSLITQIPRRTPAPALRDRLLAYGERLACLLFTRQSHAHNLIWVDSQALVPTDARYGAARPERREIAQASADKLVPILQIGRLPVIQGSVGTAPDGTATHLGPDAGDYTAALFAEALDVDELRIWTDVPGVYSTDPHVVSAAWPLSHLSFAEAQALTAAGGQVIHPHTVGPARSSGFPIWVGSALSLNAAGTWIGVASDETPKAVCALASQSIQGLWLGELDAKAPEDVCDNLIQRLLDKGGRLLERTSERCLLAFEHRLRFSYEENRWLRQSGEWREIQNVRAVSLIGNDLATVLAQHYATLTADLNVLALSHVPESGIARIFLNDTQAAELLRRLHKALFETEVGLDLAA